MRISQLFGRTLRQDPGDAESTSHRLMLKAGLIHQVAAGVYAYMPLAYRSLRKIEQIIREEMDAAGGQEVHMPALQPLELWQDTERASAFGPNLFQLNDRRGRELVLAPTHEEVITQIVKSNVNSYRDLPMILYQIQTKFRDELRPRAGLIRSREFSMKDAYSFHAGEDDLAITYERVVQAYMNIFQRCGLPTIAVEADSGAIGGKDSHEFILPAENGEDLILHCTQCRYAANVERATSRLTANPQENELPIHDIHTPGARTIPDVAKYLNVPESKTLKAVFGITNGEIIFATIRGDLQVNEVKLANVLKARDLRMATDKEIANAGLVAGSASPVGLHGIKIIGDTSITHGTNFVVGANREGYHLCNTNYPRDFHADIIADIAMAEENHGCPKCPGSLKSIRGIEVGHVFKLGTFFSERLGASYLDTNGIQHPIVMGCYGIGISRLLAATIEQNHDDNGIIFPEPIAPYHVYLIALNSETSQVRQAADEIYAKLNSRGFGVLYDDREGSAGIKFKDADLLGLPVRVIVSTRTLQDESAEIKLRGDNKSSSVKIRDAISWSWLPQSNPASPIS